MRTNRSWVVHVVVLVRLVEVTVDVWVTVVGVHVPHMAGHVKS